MGARGQGAKAIQLRSVSWVSSDLNARRWAPDVDAWMVRVYDIRFDVVPTQSLYLFVLCPVVVDPIRDSSHSFQQSS